VVGGAGGWLTRADAQRSYTPGAHAWAMSGETQGQAAPAPTAYCVKCRVKREIRDPKPVVYANGRKGVKGTCPACGGNLNRLGG
jgi:hypothetical protein